MPRLKLVANRFKHLFFRFFTTRRVLTAHCEKYDLRFRFSINDGLGRDIYYKYGVYSEDSITTFLQQEMNIQDDDFIIDIGANLGWYSLVFSVQQRPTIYAFEPDALNFSLLKENVELNKKPNVQLFNKAVGDKAGVLTFYLYKGYNLGRHSFIQQKNSVGTVEVETVRLDDFLKEKNMDKKRIKFIKIDIEGFEYSAMQGAVECLERCDYLLTEFTPGMMKQIDQNPMDYIHLLKDNDFTIYSITDAGLSQPDFDNIINNNLQVNLFCRKERGLKSDVRSEKEEVGNKEVAVNV